MAKNIFKKIRNIAQAMLNPLPVGEPWYEERLKICTECPLNSDNVEAIEGALHEVREFRCPETRYCTACGCCIDRKAAVKAEECGAVDKGLAPKWTALEYADVNNQGFHIENLTPEICNLKQDGKKFLFDFGYIDQPKVEGVFEIEMPQGVTFKTAIAGCSCTVTTPELKEGNILHFPYKVSTTGFRDGSMTDKNISIYFTRNGVDSVVNIKLRFYKK